MNVIADNNSGKFPQMRLMTEVSVVNLLLNFRMVKSFTFRKPNIILMKTANDNGVLINSLKF